jgi:hypothetical protein
MTMDSQDLQVRYEKLVHENASLRLQLDQLTAQAYALLWHVPGDVHVDKLQQMRVHMDQVLVEAARWRAKGDPPPWDGSLRKELPPTWEEQAVGWIRKRFRRGAVPSGDGPAG